MLTCFSSLLTSFIIQSVALPSHVHQSPFALNIKENISTEVFLQSHQNVLRDIIQSACGFDVSDGYLMKNLKIYKNNF